MTPADPRVERTRRVVLDATLQELAEVGYGALSIESIARRAGASKATIYRHWSGKLDLVADAVTMLKRMPQPPDVDDPYERIVGLVEAVADHIANSQYAKCVPALIEASLRDEAVRAFHVRTSNERLAFSAALLDEAKSAGHLPDDLDTAALAERLIAPVFFRRMMGAAPFPVGEVRALVDGIVGPYWR